MLQPRDKDLMGTTLHYPYQIRDSKEYFDAIANVKVARTDFPGRFERSLHRRDAELLGECRDLGPLIVD